MRKYILIIATVSVTALAQDCSQSNFRALSDVECAVSRLLSLPGYTVWDERILNKSGDSAAVAMMKSVPVQEMTSPEKKTHSLDSAPGV
jgi:hypothetical protein